MADEKAFRSNINFYVTTFIFKSIVQLKKIPFHSVSYFSDLNNAANRWFPNIPPRRQKRREGRLYWFVVPHVNGVYQFLCCKLNNLGGAQKRQQNRHKPATCCVRHKR